MAAKRDEWTCGYVAALADHHRMHHDSSAIGMHLVSEGFTTAKLRRAGVESYDLDEVAPLIRAATRRKRGTPAGSRDA